MSGRRMRAPPVVVDANSRERCGSLAAPPQHMVARRKPHKSGRSRMSRGRPSGGRRASANGGDHECSDTAFGTLLRHSVEAWGHNSKLPRPSAIGSNLPSIEQMQEISIASPELPSALTAGGLISWYTLANPTREIRRLIRGLRPAIDVPLRLQIREGHARYQSIHLIEVFGDESADDNLPRERRPPWIDGGVQPDVAGAVAGRGVVPGGAMVQFVDRAHVVQKHPARSVGVCYHAVEVDLPDRILPVVGAQAQGVAPLGDDV